MERDTEIVQLENQLNGQFRERLLNGKTKDIIQTSKNSGLRGQIVLSDRDLGLLEFVLEMKFATIDEVCEKFFRGSPANSNVVGYWYARKRLSLIEKHGFLKSERHFSNGSRYFFATKKAYLALAYLHTSKTLPKATGSIDLRTLHHDHLVLRMRMEFERRNLSQVWVSDKSLKQSAELVADLGENYLPDAVYSGAATPPTAFELEIATKSKSRYRDKIWRYRNCLKASGRSPDKIKKVHYVCAKDNVRRLLENETKLYPEFFIVEPLSKYLKEVKI